MKVLFKNITKYDKENCNNFVEFHNKKYGKKELVKFILAIIITIYIIIFNIIYKNWLLLLVAVIVGIVLYILNSKKQRKKEKVKEFTFYFYEKYIKIKYKRQFDRMMYLNFHKIFETDKYFFLYLDEKQSFILNKEGFKIGTAKEFSEFIRKKCPLKYSNERRK